MTYKVTLSVCLVISFVNKYVFMIVFHCFACINTV